MSDLSYFQPKHQQEKNILYIFQKYHPEYFILFATPSPKTRTHFFIKNQVSQDNKIRVYFIDESVGFFFFFWGGGGWGFVRVNKIHDKVLI